MAAGTLLGGRVHHAQPETGHRTGIEPVLLAASIPARQGDFVVEGGTGSGAGLLCLAARVAGIAGAGIERDPAMAAVARANVTANGFDSLAIVEADLTHWQAAGVVDHAFANPPWHDAAGTASPDAQREAAKRGAPGLLAAWAAALARPLRWHGTLTLIFHTAVLQEAMAACIEAGCGSLAVLPLWPKTGRPAKLLLLRAIKGGRGPCRMLPGLVLHEPDGRFTAPADAILSGGAALSFDATA